MPNGAGAPAAGSPETEAVASTVASDDPTLAQRFMSETGGKADAALRLCWSSASNFQSACGDTGSLGTIVTVSPGSQSYCPGSISTGSIAARGVSFQPPEAKLFSPPTMHRPPPR